jgi:PAS domain S-box-containing protein
MLPEVVRSSSKHRSSGLRPIAAVLLAAIIAAVDWLLPSVQLAYLEIIPVLMLGAQLGLRAAIVAAFVVTVPSGYLEYIGGFRESDADLPLNIAIMAVLFIFVSVLFERWRAAERERARQKADEERERLVERLVEASDDSIEVLDTDGRIAFINTNGLRAHGTPVVGTTWLTLWAEHRAEAEAAFSAARAGGHGRFVGSRVRDGRESWWDVTVKPIAAGDDPVHQYLAVARDVTETDSTNRDLALSEERYRLVGASLPGMTWTATPDGLLDYISDGATAMDLPVESLLGPAWLEIVHPEDRDRVIAVWRASLDACVAYEIEFRIRMAGGAYRWHLVRALPQRDELGSIVRWVGVNVDIDDQRRAAEQREKMEMGLRALAGAGAEMYGSLAYEDTLRNIAQAVAGSFATACTIDLLGEDGEYRRVAAAHPRADMRAIFGQYTDTSRFTPQHPIVKAIEFGDSTCIGDVSGGWTAEQLPSLSIVVEMLQIRSILCVPVRSSDGAVIGALTCSLDRADPRPSYAPEDVPFAEELGRRAGIAVEHARAYERERTIAVRFQETSLSSVLPTVDDGGLPSRY